MISIGAGVYYVMNVPPDLNIAGICVTAFSSILNSHKRGDEV
jgi:hypothetical protein